MHKILLIHALTMNKHSIITMRWHSFYMMRINMLDLPLYLCLFVSTILSYFTIIKNVSQVVGHIE